MPPPPPLPAHSPSTPGPPPVRFRRLRDGTYALMGRPTQLIPRTRVAVARRNRAPCHRIVGPRLPPTAATLPDDLVVHAIVDEPRWHRHQGTMFVLGHPFQLRPGDAFTLHSAAQRPKRLRVTAVRPAPDHTPLVLASTADLDPHFVLAPDNDPDRFHVRIPEGAAPGDVIEVYRRDDTPATVILGDPVATGIFRFTTHPPRRISPT